MKTNKFNPRDVDVTLVHEWNDGEARERQDYLVGEQPLEIRINGHSLTVTMRTPGHDLELAAGLLFTEGIIDRAEQIVSVGYANPGNPAERGNIVDIKLATDAEFDWEVARRNFFSASSCGICGKAMIEAIRTRGVKPVNTNFEVTSEAICLMPVKMTANQRNFSRTGGLHAAGLFTASGELIAEREDIGRHNALDKIVGWALQHGNLPLADCVLLVSGRGGFEIVQKAAVAGAPVVASLSACSSLAVQFAREMRMTLIGFLRGKRFVVYCGENRLK